MLELQVKKGSQVEKLALSEEHEKHNRWTLESYKRKMETHLRVHEKYDESI
jgi:hypothetical protein